MRRRAIELAGPALAGEEHDGERYWDAAGRTGQAAPPDGAYLLPAFDEYTVAYQDRSLLADGGPQVRSDQLNSDLLNPVMLLDGRAAGLWKRVVGGKSVQISLAPCGRLGRPDQPAGGGRRAVCGVPRAARRGQLVRPG